VPVQGTFLLRVDVDLSIERTEELAVFLDERSWSIEREGRVDGDSYLVEMAQDQYDPKAFAGLDASPPIAKKGRRVVVSVKKQPGHSHEDDIWRLFDRLGCDAISASHIHFQGGRQYTRFNPRLFREDERNGARAGREFDVIAALGNRTFLVEAKDEASYGKVDEYLRELATFKKTAVRTMEEVFPRNHVHMVLWYSNPEMPSTETEELAKKMGILLLCGAHLRYYGKMAAERSIARYSFVRDLLRGEVWSNVPRQYPAIRISPPGAKTYYFGVGIPHELMQVCRVDRRSPIREQTYQRMFLPKKIRSARQYLERPQLGYRGSFGNAIVLCTDGTIEFEAMDDTEEPNVGILKLPSRYGHFSVVDGQHRLFSYMDTDRENNRELPFVLFPEATEEFARAMFVSINDNQQKVPGELLWDIRADIEPDDAEVDSSEYRKFLIARVARRLALNEDGPLGGVIFIFGLPVGFRADPHITLTTVCRALDKTSALRFQRGPDTFSLRRPERKLDDEAAFVQKWLDALLNALFTGLSKSLPEEWRKKDEGRVFNNNAVAVHIYFLDRILPLVGQSKKDDLRTALSELQPFVDSYAQFWKAEVESDDQVTGKPGGGELNKLISSEGGRGTVLARALAYVGGLLDEKPTEGSRDE